MTGPGLLTGAVALGGGLAAGGVSHTARDTVLGGSLLLALPVAFAAGLVSFLSPCVLPLVPGYLSYVTGLSGADLTDRRRVGPGTMTAPAAVRGRSRVVAGSVLFVAGFSVVFVSAGVLFGSLGAWLQTYSPQLTRALGVLVVVLGLGFMGLFPGMSREWRVHPRLPGGVAAAPLLGLAFGLGWAPCIGPTLAAVQTLAFDQGTAARGALLSAAYCAGLGLPFVLTAVLYRRALGAFAVVRRHSVLVMRLGGLMLVVLGLLLVTGLWDDLTIHLRLLAAQFTPGL